MNLAPTYKNFSVDRFAPDLSKIYSLYTSYFDQMDGHLKQRQSCTKMSHVRAKDKEVNMLLVWMMMWILGRQLNSVLT